MITPFQKGLYSFRISLFWTIRIVPFAIGIGSVCAFFLWSLNGVTQCRFEHPWLLFLLPFAGLGIGLLYHHWGKSSEGGNNLILEQIHEPGGGVPRRMAPLILFATLGTHLFGGSVGREGTAVQMGGSMASAWGKILKLHPQQMRVLLICGVAAGFGSVFGTPLAGALFAVEVLTSGLKIESAHYRALLPALLAALVGDWSCRAWGITHTLYQLDYLPKDLSCFHFLTPFLLIKVALIGIAAGLVGRLFVKTEHTLNRFFNKISPCAPLRPFIGGFIIIALVYCVGTREYLGLGDYSPNSNDLTLMTLFTSSSIHYGAWAWKLLFTAVTLASGFKGGEVTPLFFIGAALGNALAGLLGGPTDLFAALGFVAIFAGASNTPLACTLMGIELFGLAYGIPITAACFLAYLCSSHSGIYPAQRVSASKK